MHKRKYLTEWRVSFQFLDDKKIYQVYRRFDDSSGVYHTSSREWAKGIFKTKEEAQERADQLNRDL